MSSLVTDILSPSDDCNPPSDLSQSTTFVHRRKSSATYSQYPSDATVSSFSQHVNSTKKREVFRFKANWLVSSIAWSNEPSQSFHLALCSYIENYINQVQLVRLVKDDYDQVIHSVSAFEHPYPATKALWIPRTPNSSYVPQILATTADYLRLWRVVDTSEYNDKFMTSNSLLGQSSSPKTTVKLECLLNPIKGVKHCAPLTSFDWNDIDPSMIVTASVDTTCAIWDIEASKLINSVGSELSGPNEHSRNISANLRNQIVAHNHEVYDVCFSRSGSGRDIFVSAGGDGTVRLFDLRRLNTSTVVYELDRLSSSPDRTALVRVGCNKQNPNFISAFANFSKDIFILDLRYPRRPITILSSHTANLNSMSWAPHTAHHICTASDDCQALIWDLSKIPEPIGEPQLAYRANGKINVINWSASHSDWIAIGFENYLELLRV